MAGGYTTRRNVGGDYSTTISNSYWDTVTTEQPTSAGGMGRTTDEMKQASTYVYWGNDVWNIVDGKYPTLKNSH